MTERDVGVLISNEAELLAWVGYSGPDAIDDWLRDACEFADDFDDDGDDGMFRRVIFHRARRASSQYSIQLAYPFLTDALIEEADRAELHFRGAMNAVGMAVEGATLGCPESEDDRTGDFAGDVLGGVEVVDVVEVLAGEWRFIDMSVGQGSSGEVIFAWYVPADDRMVALGIGPDELFVVPLFEDDEGVWVEEWPDPTVGLWWTGEWAKGIPLDDPATTLESLRAEFAMYSGGSRRLAAAADPADHEVRLSTANLLVSGIDLDFEVKKGGRTLGTLSVSKGGLLWRPTSAHRRKGRAKSGFKKSWTDFENWAEQ